MLANDTDVDSGDVLTITAATASSGSNITINTDNTLTYTPSDFLGTDTITYTVSDGNGGTDTATFDIEVTLDGVATDGPLS